MFEETLITQFQIVEINLQSSTLLRTKAFKLDSKYLKQLRTHFTCLNYLRKKFEYVLSYKHAIYNICFQILKLNLKN